MSSFLWFLSEVSEHREIGTEFGTVIMCSNMEMDDADAIYECAPDDDREFARAIRVCLMGMTSFPPLTFQASGPEGFTSEWRAWHEDVFDPVIGPHLVQSYEAAQKNQVLEVLAADQKLDARLDTARRDRSAQGGCRLQGLLAGARHVRQMERFRDAVLRQDVIGHFATILAVEAALFHVPLMHVLPACLFAEWRGGARNLGGQYGTQDTSIGQFLVSARTQVASSRKTLQANLTSGPQIIVCAQ